jgi:uncharacterized protein (DUF4213/DUF364 family)
MRFATELLSLLERFSRLAPLPRVRALHLPPPELAGTKQGEFCAVELEDGSLGLSYVLLDDTLAKLAASPDRFGLLGCDGLAAARRYADGDGVTRTLGFAAVNALTRCLFDRAAYLPDASGDSIGAIDPRAGDHVGMIGLFSPLVGRVVAAGARLTVVELKPELAGDYDGYRVTLDPQALGACNKVLSTSTILLNDTLDRMLACCQRAEVFAMIGPGASCVPDPLFARGVSVIGGVWITDPQGFVDALAHGDSWSGCARKFTIERDRYPGVDALLERLR